jgi:hypothetical protein
MQKINILLAYIPCSHGLIDFRFSGHFGWAGTRTDNETRQGYAASLQKFVEKKFLLQRKRRLTVLYTELQYQECEKHNFVARTS